MKWRASLVSWYSTATVGCRVPYRNLMSITDSSSRRMLNASCSCPASSTGMTCRQNRVRDYNGKYQHEIGACAIGQSRHAASAASQQWAVWQAAQCDDEGPQAAAVP